MDMNRIAIEDWLAESQLPERTGPDLIMPSSEPAPELAPEPIPEQDPIESESTQERRASIDSILDAVARARSVTSFDEPVDNSSSNGE